MQGFFVILFSYQNIFSIYIINLRVFVAAIAIGIAI